MIRLLKTSDDKRKLTKSFTVIKDSVNYDKMDMTDIINPSYTIEYFNEIYNANYLYDDTTHRYYYIDNIGMEDGGRCTLYCNVDVLMSFANEIKSVIGTIDRNEYKKNGYLYDSNYKAYSYNQIVTKRFPNAMTDDSIILLTVG